QDAATMLLAGEIDAAILAPPPKDARLQPVIADPESAARAWYRRTQAVQINHMVVVRESLTRSHPEAVREFWRLLVESRRRGGSTLEDGIDARPYGLDAIRRPLEVAIDCVVRQGLVPRRLGVDELFDEVTRSFAV
ncbi:MAG: phosphate ABC transporter substrate-binding protein, partial [Betaproteobacteria bacterium]|nr:phosphate ABC transporter substrate-binding protein [Betaproteobacteria bacterium]